MVIRILVLGSPPDIDTNRVIERIREIAGICDTHHVRLWQVNENTNAFDAHLVIVPDEWARADYIKDAVKSALPDDFSINHITLELECFVHACNDAETIGHGVDHTLDYDLGHTIV